MHYRLIALDLDGTLLTSRQSITPRTRAALLAARERGIVAALATGRTPQSALQYRQFIGPGPIICCNGACVLDEDGSTITQKGIPSALLLRAIELARDAQALTQAYTPQGVVIDQPIAQVRTVLHWARPQLSTVKALGVAWQHWRINRTRTVRSLATWAERPTCPPVLKLFINGQRDQLKRLAEQLRRTMPGLEVSSSGADNIEVTGVGINKASGLEALCSRLKIPSNAVIAFGDSSNDLDMLRYAGLGVAMGNGSPGAKAAADRIAPSCDEEGVAQVVEELCLQ